MTNIDDLIKSMEDNLADGDVYFIKYMLPTDSLYLWAQLSIEMILRGEY